MLEDAEEEFSKPYNFPAGPSENDTIAKEDDDLADEMTHGDDKNDFSDVTFDVIPAEKRSALNDELSKLEEVVVEQKMKDIKSVGNDVTPLDDVTEVKSRDLKEMQPKTDSNVKHPDGFEDQPSAKSNDQSSASLSDQLEVQIKRSVKAYIRKLLNNVANKRK